MADRPPKLAPSSTLVIWGAKKLTLTEKVVWYHDWALDQGGADGSYISVRSMSERLGRSLAPHTIEQARGHLKRLTLHEAVRRRDCRNLGWISTLPPQYVAHRAKDAVALAVLLDAYIVARESWLVGRPPTVAQSDGLPADSATATGADSAAALAGGLGGSLLDQLSETQLPSVVREKGVGSHEPETTEGRGLAAVRSTPKKLGRLRQQDDIERPMDADERAGWEAMLAKMPADRAAKLRRIAGL